MPLTWSDRYCLTASWPGRRRCRPRCRSRGSSGSAAGSCLSSPENKMWLTSDDIWLTLTTPPQVRSLITQQTPNPWAQLPSGSPDWNTSEWWESLLMVPIFQSKCETRTEGHLYMSSLKIFFKNIKNTVPLEIFVLRKMLGLQKMSGIYPKIIRSPENIGSTKYNRYPKDIRSHKNKMH